MQPANPHGESYPHERLKKRADRHRRSMNSEAIRILERALESTRMSVEEVIAEAKALNEQFGKPLDSKIIEEKSERASHDCR